MLCQSFQCISDGTVTLVDGVTYIKEVKKLPRDQGIIQIIHVTKTNKNQVHLSKITQLEITQYWYFKNQCDKFMTRYRICISRNTHKHPNRENY